MKTDLEIAQHDLSGSHLDAEEGSVAVDDFDAEAAITHAETKTMRPEAALFDPALNPAPADVANTPRKRRALLVLGMIAALGVGGYYGHYWWTEGRFYVSTDDAYVKADLSVISAKVAGIITAVPVKDNITVHAGDVLAQIDDRDYKIAVDLARNKLATQDATIERLKQQAIAQQAMIDQAKAQVASMKASLVRASADFERAQTLAQREYGSQQKLDQARADRDQGQAAVRAAEAAEVSAQANLTVLNAQVQEAQGVRAELQSSLDKALLDLSYATVRAPFSGVIGNKAVQVGQYVQPGTRLLSLVPLDTAYIEANYKETSSTASALANRQTLPWMPLTAASSTASWKASRRRQGRNIRCCRPKTRRATSPRSSSGCRCASALMVKPSAMAFCAPACPS